MYYCVVIVYIVDVVSNENAYLYILIFMTICMY